jgi:hypothetical protein
MERPSKETPSRRYQDVARFFRAYASAEKMQIVARPATIDEIDRAEHELGARFPMSYRWFQLEFGDVQDGPLDIYTTRTPNGPYSRNIVETNLKERTEAGPRLPAPLIAFSDNGGGDLLCFDTTRPDGDECPVVSWDHELDEDQEPQDAAPSFLDWIERELKEMAAEARPSVLDVLPQMYKQWMNEWVRQFRK